MSFSFAAGVPIGRAWVRPPNDHAELLADSVFPGISMQCYCNALYDKTQFWFSTFPIFVEAQETQIQAYADT